MIFHSDHNIFSPSKYNGHLFREVSVIRSKQILVLEVKTMPASILIIGSGAVGALYTQALADAWCKVEFLIRDREGPNAKMPRTFYRYCVAL